MQGDVDKLIDGYDRGMVSRRQLIASIGAVGALGAVVGASADDVVPDAQQSGEPVMAVRDTLMMNHLAAAYVTGRLAAFDESEPWAAESKTWLIRDGLWRCPRPLGQILPPRPCPPDVPPVAPDIFVKNLLRNIGFTGFIERAEAAALL